MDSAFNILANAINPRLQKFIFRGNQISERQGGFKPRVITRTSCTTLSAVHRLLLGALGNCEYLTRIWFQMTKHRYRNLTAILDFS